MPETGVSFRLEGGQELANRLRQLPAKMARRILNAALRKAAGPMVATARSLAPVAKSISSSANPGLIQRNIAVINKRGGTDMIRGIIIGVRLLKGRRQRRGAAWTRRLVRAKGLMLGPSYFDPYYWYFWEHGWNVSGRWRGRGMTRTAWRAARRGSVPFIQKEFLGPAFRSNVEGFLGTFSAEIYKRLPEIF